MAKRKDKLELLEAQDCCPKCGADAGHLTFNCDGGPIGVVDCGKCGHKWREEDPDEVPTVTCKFCGDEARADKAHRHSGGWVGDECCWDERLRCTE
jgi:hypothetical protein